MLTCHTVLRTLPGVAIFGRDMQFDVPYLANWTKIGEYRQKRETTTPDGRTLLVLTGIINPVIKYCGKKMVSSTRLKADMKVILGLSFQLIQMAP